MKKRFYLLGISLLTGALGSLAIRKTQQKKLKNGLPDDLSAYCGTWTFQDKHEIPHQLTVTPDFSFAIDNKKLDTALIDLSKEQLVVRDQYGFHLAMAFDPDPVLYDEAEDRYFLLKQS